MRFQVRMLVLALSVILTISALGLSAAPKSSAATVKATGMMIQMPLVAPLFIEDRNFTSTLVMVNGSSTTSYADVVLTGLDGQKIAQHRISFGPHSQQRLEIQDLLQEASSAATTGSLTVTQSPDLKGMAILAQLSITYRGSPEPSYIDEELAMPSSSGSQILRGVADAGDGSPLLAVTSLTESLQHISIRCIDDGHKEFFKPVDLAAGETVVTEACSPPIDHSADFETVLEGANGGRPGAVGIELLSDAMPGSFAAFGLVPHRQEDDRFFSVINFADPKMILSTTTVFTGVPVGPSTLLPQGEYVPQVTLANFSTRDINVDIRYAFTSGTSPTVKDVGNIVVSARSSKALTLGHLQGDPGLKNSFLIIGDGSPGDLIAKLDSTSESQLREMELVGKDAADLENGGSHPWSLNSGGDSTLLLFNHSAALHYFNVIVSAGAVLWQKAYQLSAMQTLAISIGDLIQNRVKDDKGQILPQDVQSGQVGWFATAVASGKGRVLQSNRETAMARSFSCGDIYVVCGAQFTADRTTFSVGDNGISFGTIQPIICLDQSGQVDCTGTLSDLGGNGDSFQWTSQNSNIISINQPATGPSVTVNGVAAGTAFVDGTVTDAYGCSGTDGSDGTVFQFVMTGKSFIFVGTDPNLVASNLFGATDGNGGSPKPTGGTLSATSSDSNDTFQYTQGSLPRTNVTTPDQGVNRGLTFTYTLSSGAATSQSLTVTARQFAWVNNDSPPNICSNYGYDYTYTYTPYTHPDGQVVDSGAGAGGTAVTETVSPQPGGTACTNFTETGDGALDSNGQFLDHVQLCSNSPIPSCDKTYTQILNIAGFQVRTNTLETKNTGLTYTNQGPTQ